MGKNILIIRGGMEKPLVKAFDTFDSTVQVFEADKEIIKYDLVNTDFYRGYQGGILAEGVWFYICGLRKDSKNKCLYLTNTLITNTNQLTEEMRVFPSLIPNPNHGGKNIITQVLVHCDGTAGGWSHGCITIHPENWNKFINKFKINESGMFYLSRSEKWNPPDYYQERN